MRFCVFFIDNLDWGLLFEINYAKIPSSLILFQKGFLWHRAMYRLVAGNNFKIF